MASASSLPASLIAELRREIAENGVEPVGEGLRETSFVRPASLPDEYALLSERSLPAQPLAVVLDVYGTLLASAVGDIGLGADGAGPTERAGSSAAFPHDLAERLRSIIAEDHAAARRAGIPWPEVDSPSVFARALGLDREDGARACVAWECMTNRCAAMPGAADFLSDCAARGLALGIVSNAQFYTPLFVEAAFGAGLSGEAASGGPRLGIDPELTLWSYETGRAKPDRWMFDELARRLARRGIPADRILYVGNDGLNDCAAAGEAGYMTALFAGDARSFKPRLLEPRVRSYPPSAVAISWHQARRLLCT